MDQELKNALEAMKANLENKTAVQIKAELETLEAKYGDFLTETKANEVIAGEIKTLNDELTAEIKKVQDHADALDVKMKAVKTNEVKKAGFVDNVKTAIAENLEKLGSVKKGNAVELKVVGDMTLGASLTGDQPRDYSNTVAMVPSQLVNVADLVQSITISGEYKYLPA